MANGIYNILDTKMPLKIADAYLSSYQNAQDRQMELQDREVKAQQLAAKQASDLDAQEQKIIEDAALEWAANPTKDNMLRSVRMLEGRVRPEKLMPMYQRAMTATPEELPNIAKGIIARFTTEGKKRLAEQAFPAAPEPVDEEMRKLDLDYKRAQIAKLRERPAAGAASTGDGINWRYDQGSDEFVAPPTPEFPQGRRSGSIAKEGARRSLEYVISQFKEPLQNTPQGGFMGATGMIGRVTDSQSYKRFNNLREQLSTELRTLFRIPGEGALSDREQAQYGVQLPDVSNSKETNEAILRDIQARVAARLDTGANPLQAAPSVSDQGAVINVGGQQMVVLGRNADGSIRIKDPRTGRTGTVRP